MTGNVLLLRHMEHEAAGTVIDALAGAGIQHRYVDLFEEVPDRLPLEEAIGLVVLGGSMNADEVDRYRFLAVELEWIREAVARGLPVLGICLGSQLLAKALGARVYRNPVKEIGWHPIRFNEAAAGDRLLQQQGDAMVFQWHGDTFDLPEGAELLASSAVCRHQAFRYGESAWGLQFHLEMTAEMIDCWLRHPVNSVEFAGRDDLAPERIAAETPGHLPAMQRLAADVFGRFAESCRR